MKRILLALTLALLPTAALPQSGGIDFDNSVTVTPTVQAASYSATNSFGGLQTINIFRSDTQAGAFLTEFWIASQGGNTGAMTLYVFDTAPSSATVCTDKTALTLAAADVPKLAVAPFVLTPAVPEGSTASIADVAIAKSIRNHDAPPTQKLYVCIVANATISPGTTTDIVFKIALRGN